MIPANLPSDPAEAYKLGRQDQLAETTSQLQEMRSNGGKRAAAKMTAKQRRNRALKAVQARELRKSEKHSQNS